MPVIRPAVPADEAFLIALTPRLADFPVPPWRTREEIAVADHAILREALRQPSADACILVAEEPAGTPVGYAFTTTRTDYFTHELHAHVEVLAVSESAAGRGVARALMDATEQWARERGYRRITLNVFERNARARAVYDRLGYAPETLHYIKQL
jgi:GNAT superfamily N-acetyltransferase